MPTLPQQCVNYEINLLMCPCTSEACSNRGICCECIQAHSNAGKPTACMRGALRKPETMTLNERAQTVCMSNQVRNQEFCVCDYKVCNHHGLCCNCVRNHFTADGTGRTACMVSLA